MNGCQIKAESVFGFLNYQPEVVACVIFVIVDILIYGLRLKCWKRHPASRLRRQGLSISAYEHIGISAYRHIGMSAYRHIGMSNIFFLFTV